MNQNVNIRQVTIGGYSDTVVDNNEPLPADDFSDTVKLDDIEIQDTEQDQYLEEMKFEENENANDTNTLDESGIALHNSTNDVEIR